jgi:hypothetical protein
VLVLGVLVLGVLVLDVLDVELVDEQLFPNPREHVHPWYHEKPHATRQQTHPNIKRMIIIDESPAITFGPD